MQFADGRELAQPAPSRPSSSRPALLRDPRFLTMAAAFALGMFAQIGLVAHLIARLTPELGARGAAAALSLITLCAILGRTLLGWCLRDHNRRSVAALNFFVQSLGVLLLATGGGTTLLLVGCVLFGLTGGNHLTLPPLMAQQEFDLPTLPPLLPSASPSVRARWSSGRPPSGYSMMRTGDYVLPFALAAIADVLAACPPDRRQEVHMTAGSRTNSSLALAPGECGRQEIFRSPFARLLPAHADPTMVSPAHIPRGCGYESHRARNTRPTPPRRRLPILTPGNLSEVVSAQRNGALMTGK
jgi:hypothetical protein